MSARRGRGRQTLQHRRVVVVNWRDLDHTLAGGSEIYAWQFARALREGGAEVTFLTAREPGARRAEAREGIEVRRGGGPLTFYLYAAWWLLMHRWRLDAVIDPACGLPSFSPLFVSLPTPVLLIMHHVHQDQFGVHFPAPVAALGRWLERVAMRVVYRRRRAVAVSESTRLEMRSRLAWRGPVGLLENGADIPDTPLDDLLGKDADRLVVLGRLVAHKRVDLVLRALRDVLRDDALRGRDLHLDIIGRGPERSRLQTLAGELGLADRVTFHGYVTEEAKAALLARASVHVCASDAEGWGQAVLDAAAWGVPTVARDVPGLRDSIRRGETGWLVPDGADLDVVRRRLGDAIVRALVDASDPDVRIHRVSACQAWAREFDWSQMRVQARTLTAQILGVPRPARPAHPARPHKRRAHRAAIAER